MRPEWLHCNICRKSADRVNTGFNITNCGTIFCSDCRDVITTRVCQDCLGPCKKSLPLDGRAPEEVKVLFESFESQAASLLRSASFQDDQLRNLFDLHNQERKSYEEFDRRYQEEMEAMLRMKKDLQDSLEKEERREAFLQGKLEYIENEERRRREEKREIEAREERKKALEGREERRRELEAREERRREMEALEERSRRRENLYQQNVFDSGITEMMEAHSSRSRSREDRRTEDRRRPSPTSSSLSSLTSFTNAKYFSRSR